MKRKQINPKPNGASKWYCRFTLSLLRIIAVSGLLVSSALNAQSGNITGKVQDAQAVGIAGAQVKLVVRDLSATTDQNGAFLFSSTSLSLNSQTVPLRPQVRGTEIV